MPKVIALMNFRGANFAEKFEEGNIYDLEGARAESLALRGLVKPLSEDKPQTEAPKVEEPKEETDVTTEVKETPETEVSSQEVTEAPKVEEPVQTARRGGRPRKTE